MINFYFILSLVITIPAIIGFKRNHQLNLTLPVVGNILVTALIGPVLLFFFFMRYKQETQYNKKVSIPNFLYKNCQFFKLKRNISQVKKKVYDFRTKKKYDFTKK